MSSLLLPYCGPADEFPGLHVGILIAMPLSLHGIHLTHCNMWLSRRRVLLQGLNRECLDVNELSSKHRRLSSVM